MSRIIIALTMWYGFCSAVSAHQCSIQVRPTPIVIAHRGASAYLPEHTLESTAWAHATGAHYIEQDVVLTRDEVPIVLHDLHLDTVTNVAQLFPHRARADGRFYAADFSIQEIRKLRLHERIDLRTGEAVFPRRFPVETTIPFRVLTLDDALALIQGMDQATGRTTGVYVELKAPRFHREEGLDIIFAVLDTLERHGYSRRDDPCFIQSFDPDCLRRIRHLHRSDLRLVQLIADDSWNETPGLSYRPMLTPDGLRRISAYADGVGPWINQILTLEPSTGKPVSTGFVENAHEFGLLVHPYTVRADSLPPGFDDEETLLSTLTISLGVDGFFTDFPDTAMDFVRRFKPSVDVDVPPRTWYPPRHPTP